MSAALEISAATSTWSISYCCQLSVQWTRVVLRIYMHVNCT